MISPARTRIASPILTSATATSSTAWPTRRWASLGARIDEGPQAALRTRDRVVLKHRPAGVHEGDHDPCERLAQRNRAAHCQEGDGVDAEAPGHQIANNGRGKGDDNGNRGRSPNPVRGVPPKQKSCRAQRKADQGDENERAPSQAFIDRAEITGITDAPPEAGAGNMLWQWTHRAENIRKDDFDVPGAPRCHVKRVVELPQEHSADMKN